MWPVSPTEALGFLLGCSFHTSHPVVPPAISDTVGALPLESAAVESSQLKAGTAVAVQHALGAVDSAARQREGKRGQLCQTPVTSCGCCAQCAAHTAQPLQQQLGAAWTVQSPGGLNLKCLKMLWDRTNAGYTGL